MVQIRSARQEEAYTLAEVGYRAWETAAVGWGEDVETRENVAGAFRRFTAEHWLSIDVAEQATQIVGWSAREKLDNNITDLWVEPAFHRHGIGTKMLLAIEAEMIRVGHTELTTEVHSENNTAVSFFLKNGFRVQWMTTAWSAKLDRDVDTVGLIKDLVDEEDDRPQGYGEF